ncbi:tyrosine-type recombinase/integrase [Lewinella sp. IMCC34191]|uniref:tyrosine-type recombinase/integrase n=1 Tax=Lewinella sp. IMCC34191 TaxID=2259172 RepID=UPI000E265550|nr:tyrosine-type recombinase/integrase [Lewinella sp. IMCC34191]
MPLSAELKDPKTGERKYLDREERRAFLEATQQQEARKQYYCQLLYYTGCRLSEALAVTYNSFDFKRGYVMIRTLKQGSRDGKPVDRYRDNELPESYLNEIHGFYATVRGRRCRTAMVGFRSHGPQLRC